MDFKSCTRCLMNSTAKNFILYENNYCNFCTEFLTQSKNILKLDDQIKLNRLKEFVNKIKKDGQGKPYDCIVGISGGVDSSWTLTNVVSLGLRPLAVHMDNGWNSELAQNNIANLIKSLKVDLYTHVIDWEEYRSLMQCFFKSNVLDIELLYDNAMLAVNYNLAKKYKLKYILSGMNQSTEGLAMPTGWNWYKYDIRNIRDIANKFGPVKIKTFPTFSTFDFFYNTYIKKIVFYPFLDFIDYNKENAILDLEKNYGYKRYPYKHYESIFTRFYQGFILPKKFNVDKRLVHLSSLILTNQMSKENALQIISNSAYASSEDLNNDIDYFLKKMNWLQSDLDLYLKIPEIKHDFYKSERKLFFFINNKLRNIIPKFLINYINRNKISFEK